MTFAEAMTGVKRRILGGLKISFDGMNSLLRKVSARKVLWLKMGETPILGWARNRVLMRPGDFSEITVRCVGEWVRVRLCAAHNSGLALWFVSNQAARQWRRAGAYAVKHS